MTELTPGGEARPASQHLDRQQVQELRERVLRELAEVKGRIDLATEMNDGLRAKAQLRVAHQAQKAARFKDAAQWIVGHEDAALEHFANGSEIDPRRIDPVVVAVRTGREADLFRFATLDWSVPVSAGYGRRTRFLVLDRQNDKLIAVFSLGDPVISQSARDRAIGWEIEQRMSRLYHVYDAFVLGAVEPYRQLLGGKLAALLTLSNEVRDFLTAKYSGTTTEIRKAQKDPTPVLITTSSALGRSSVYNRVTYHGRLMLHSVGFTRGFGHFQFSDDLFGDLVTFVRREVLPTPVTKVGSSKYGSGPNWRFRVIRTALKALDIDENHLQHNVRREMFLAPVADGWREYLCGDRDDFVPYDMPAAAIGDYYRERWAIGRAERKPGYRFWTREEARISPQLTRQLRFSMPSSAPPGRIDMGAYHLAVGVAKQRFGARAKSNGGDGIAYVSRLQGPDGDVEIADVTWPSGEREVVGEIPGVVAALKLSVNASELFRNMCVADLRIARVSGGSGRVRYVEMNSTKLNTTFGFDLESVLDRLGEASVGTRRELLGEKGSAGHRLCVIFPVESRELPALLWTLARGLSVTRSAQSDSPIGEPQLVRRAPSGESLALEG
jgi:Domain of unknown function (DUF4338)